jgi:hypothetical protein
VAIGPESAAGAHREPTGHRRARVSNVGGARYQTGGVGVNRRRFLKLMGGGTATVGGGKAIYNTQIGYGVITGTNLRDQNLEPLIAERLRADQYRADLGDHVIEIADDTVTVSNGDDAVAEHSVSETTPEKAAETDAEYGLAGGPIEQLVRDLPALRNGEFVVEGAQYDAFFDRIADAETSQFAAGAMRDGYLGADPELVGEFLEADPTDPERVVLSLKAAFREHTSYDKPRYIAGSVEDNVIFGAKDLRQYFETPTDFQALEAGETPGMFCTELTRRSAEALHAVPAHEATAPVAAMYVYDRRHKHVFTGIASLLRRDGDLVMPVTFVDYTHSTLYDDIHLTGVLGEGVAAYGSRHRADEIYWHR